jgi:hypothetical protein
MWYHAEGSKFGLDKVFRLNLEKQTKLENNSKKKT